MKRVVFTGAPCTGKSSTLDELLSSFNSFLINYKPEVARYWLKFFEEHEPHKLPQNNKEYFQNFIETIEIQNWISVENLSISTIYDRSIIDQIAYRTYFGMEIPQELHEACLKYRYNKVFIFPLWSEIYVTDNIRKENIIEASKIDFNIRRAYENYGYDLIEVPFGTIEERVEFINNHI